MGRVRCTVTMRERVIELLNMSRFFGGATATTLCNEMNWIARRSNEFKLSSLSSLLHKMWKDGSLIRLPDFGPRGGNGYVLAPRSGLKRKPRNTWCCHVCGHKQPNSTTQCCEDACDVCGSHGMENIR